ncbi:MAG: prolipoprotein diacylglyceryl transferase family protein [Aureliella sp.]
MPFPIAAAYPAIMMVALACGALILRRAQSQLTLPVEQRLAIGMAAFCGAMIGAKLPFLMVNLIGNWHSLLDGSLWLSNGKTIMCGLVGAYFAVELAKWILGIRTKTGDSFVVAAAVAIAIGRLGCLAAGCCYGVPTTLPWGMRCAAIDNLTRHPTQLYESLFHASMAVSMLYGQRSGLWRGQWAKFYILSYLLYRFASETLRPEARLSWGLTVYQWFALAIAPVFVALWWYDARQLRRDAMHIFAPTPVPAAPFRHSGPSPAKALPPARDNGPSA